MKRLLCTAFVVLFAGCSAFHNHNKDPYANPFYSKYLSPSNPQDQQIQSALTGVRNNPDSAPAHNDLGQLLVQKGFPKDAEREFERSLDADSHFYPAWYNLALVRSALGDYSGARHAFHRTVHYKPGHSAALFQLGLMEEHLGNREDAIEYYAKAFLINRSLLDVHVNPRILDTSLVALSLLRAYQKEHNRESMQLQPTPAGYVDPDQEVDEESSPSDPKSVTATKPVPPPAPQTPAPLKPKS